MEEERNPMEVVAKNLVEDYVKQDDWRVNENANMAYSLQGMNNYIKEEVTKYYWMNYIYSPEVKQAHVDGRFHLHDSGSLSGYCMGLDLEDLLESGFYGGPGKVRASAPKHFKTALGQLVNQLYSVTGECYAAGAEVMTPSGWKQIQDIKVGDLVLTTNISTNEIEYKPVLRTINKAYAGELVRLKNSYMDFLVTPNHRMIVHHGLAPQNKSQHTNFVCAKDIKQCSHTLPVCFNWTGTEREYFVLKGYTTRIERNGKFYNKTVADVKIPMDDWLRFLGCYLSEGSLASRKDIDKRRGVPRIEYQVTMSQCKYTDYFRSACAAVANAIGTKVNETVFTHGRKNPLTRFIIYNKSLYNELQQFGLCYDKFIPDYVFSLSKRQINLFLEALMMGDGETSDPDYYMCAYYTTSKRLAEDVQRLYVLLGYGTSLQSRWCEHSTVPTLIARKQQMSLKKYPTPVYEKYNGTVHCVETENGTLLVRQNGFINWCGNCAGAVAVSNLDTLIAPFIYYDKLDKEQVKQAMQEFIYNLNVPTRVGYQQPFSNCTLDFTVPKHMADKPVLIGGKRMDKTYKEFQKEMDVFNECFYEVMTAGDADGRIFSFPIPTVNVTKDFDWNNPRYKSMWENTAKYGQSYFCNYVSSDMDPADAMSMCPLDKDTLVLSGYGEKVKLCDLKLGDVVYGADGKQCIVIGLTFHPRMPGIKVTLEDGAVVEYGCEHLQPILRHGKEMVVKVKELQLTDSIYEFSKEEYGRTDVVPSDKNTHYGAIKSIENLPEKNYYCITIDNSDGLFRLANGVITHNCRLRLDLSELKRKGGLFGANPLTGSVSVCTINFPRLGYLHKNDEDGFFKELDELLLLAKEALDVRRQYVEKWTDQGMYPILKFCLRKTHARFQKYWTNHFSTIATVGMNECLLNMFGYGIGDPRGREFALKVMNYLRKKAIEFQVQSGNQYNIEQAPAESTSYRLAKIDKKKYPDIIVADNETVEKEGVAPFYTNSTQLPVNYTDDIFEMMDNQSAINALYTGGSVQHLYLGERVTDLEAMKQLIKTIFSNYEIPYISITPTFSVCPVHGYLSGEHKYCPQCKSERIHKIDLEKERLQALLDKAE